MSVEPVGASDDPFGVADGGEGGRGRSSMAQFR